MSVIDKVLDQKAQEVCARLGQSALMASHYLAGGTALALQLGHRRSLDLDLFPRVGSERIASNQIIRELKRLFGEGELKLNLRQSDQVAWEIKGTRVAFIAYPFPLLYPLIEGGSISPVLAGFYLADLREIAAMKAYALGRRATFRDYVDLYFLLRGGLVSLSEVIRDASRKFVLEGKSVFSPKLFLEQLSYTEDVEDKEAALELVVERKVSSEEIQEFLKGKVRSFLEGEIERANPTSSQGGILHETP